jgi:predicted permease
MFSAFGLQPVLGRLFTDADDLVPRAAPYAVLSYDYWIRRFGNDPAVIGRNIRMGNDLLTVVGVAPRNFTGTEPGIMTDIFLPTMMHEGVTHSDWSWFRTLALLHPGVAPERVRDQLQPILRAFQEERAKGWSAQSKRFLDDFLKQTLVVQAAPSGTSSMQEDYRSALFALGVLVALVLLIACANVANLMLAQAAARAREMALRISIGAGPARLGQLVLVESAWIALFAAVLGGVFAWWSAPFVVSRINPPDNPARLALSADWRLLAFSIALTFGVAIFFGLAPALRASSITPVSALKGGDSPHSRSRLMYVLIAAQVAFCFVVHFAAGLFLSTFDHLAHQSTGFSADRIVILDITSHAPPAS